MDVMCGLNTSIAQHKHAGSLKNHNMSQTNDVLPDTHTCWRVNDLQKAVNNMTLPLVSLVFVLVV